MRFENFFNMLELRKPHIDSNLVHDTVYYYTVQAENALGNSNSSNQLNKLALKVPLSAIIDGIIPSNDSMTIYWTQSSDVGGSSSISYTLWWGTSSSNLTNSVLLSTSP